MRKRKSGPLYPRDCFAEHVNPYGQLTVGHYPRVDETGQPILIYSGKKVRQEDMEDLVVALLTDFIQRAA